MSAELCDRCDIEMTRQPFYEGSEDECWYCPCCRSRLKTTEMLRAGWERHAAALGMTWDEYETHMNAKMEKLIAQQPNERDVRQATALASLRAKEWTPVCPHDTENPWKPSVVPGEGRP